MVKIMRDHISRRLVAIREEMGLDRARMAARLGIDRKRYTNWETSAVPSLPAEQSMADLCDLLPGVTLDYIYRGKLDRMPQRLAIRLTAREMGMDPDAPEFQPDAVAAAVVRALA